MACEIAAMDYVYDASRPTGQSEWRSRSAGTAPRRRSADRPPACHGNSHRKLPKKVITPGNVPLDDVKKTEQPLYTPYYEFLIPGHKSENEIERGVLDRNSRQIYITAHYESGSFVWLSGAPKALLDNWVTKASKYRKQLMK